MWRHFLIKVCWNVHFAEGIVITYLSVRPAVHPSVRPPVQPHDWRPEGFDYRVEWWCEILQVQLVNKKTTTKNRECNDNKKQSFNQTFKICIFECLNWKLMNIENHSSNQKQNQNFWNFWNNSIFECLNWKLMNIEKWNKW